MKKILGANNPNGGGGGADDPLGIKEIKPPIDSGGGDPGTVLETLINNGFKIAFVLLGLYALLNFILAAFNYINSQGEQEKVVKAQKMITNSIIGLALLAMTFIVAGVIGQVFFGDWNALLDLDAAIKSIQ